VCVYVTDEFVVNCEEPRIVCLLVNIFFAMLCRRTGLFRQARSRSDCFLAGNENVHSFSTVDPTPHTLSSGYAVFSVWLNINFDIVCSCLNVDKFSCSYASLQAYMTVTFCFALSTNHNWNPECSDITVEFCRKKIDGILSYMLQTDKTSAKKEKLNLSTQYFM